MRTMEGFGQLPLFPSCIATMSDATCLGEEIFDRHNLCLPEARCHLTFPTREKQRWNRFQRLCGLLGFSGAVASDGRPKSRRHWTEEQDEMKELTFSIAQVQKTSTEPLWGRHDIQGRQKGEREVVRRTLKTFGLKNGGLGCAFTLTLLKSDMTEKASCKRPESRHNRPPALRFNPLRGAKWPSVQLYKILFLAHSKHSGVETTWQIWQTVILIFWKKNLTLFLWSLDQPASTFQCVPGACASEA